ncbi:putative anti-sigma-YlaC factor YlaD [Amycolatopsis jiangsuensis]|uniref:Putative anti-sigma-YlaC factor YlaD n=1 Tax=Amycolatopsis jiangsuensis TaxID=1181879 RepID=A0A840IQP0_9PSEU|nr:putative anti-sigma-YlaC factor YlaD [Amycolatopsis jiangsuensis]
MSCEIFREALSARLDGEAGPLPEDQVDAHLASCAACRSWYERSATLRRSMLVRAAPPVPDLTARIMAETPAPPREKWALRVALALVGLVQCGLAFAQLLGMDPGMHDAHSGFMEGHLLNESAAWNLAVGVGLLWAALRTRAASGLLPMITGFVVVLAVLTTGDLLGDRVTAARVLSHTFLVVGLVLLFAVHRQHRARHRPGPDLADAVDSGEETTVRYHGALALARPHGKHGRDTERPTGRRRAA